MKRPDNWKHESWLRRILDSDRFDQIVYFEEAVLADSNTLQAKGYYLFLITETSLHYLQTGKDTSLNSANSWLLTDFHAILHLNDAATFFGDNNEVAQSSRHIRCHVSDQVASPISVLDFYSFYEDSCLYHFLFQAWQQAHTRAALQVFYPTERNKLSKLSKLAVQALYLHLETQLLATAKDDDGETAAQATAAAAEATKKVEEGKGDTDGDGIDDQRIKAAAAKLRAKRKKASDHEYWDIRLRIKILEEMTLAAAAHRSFKQLAFDSQLLIPFLLQELKTHERLRAYLLGADPVQIWHYISRNTETLLEDELDRIRLVIAIWGFLSRILAGSECVPARTKLLAWHSTSTEGELKQVMNSVFLLGGIPVYDDRSSSSSAGAPNSPNPPLSPTSAQTASIRQVTPSKFLEHLDAHLEDHQANRKGAKFFDEDDERYKQKYLYNLRVNRKWKEGVLGVALETTSTSSTAAGSSSSSSSTKKGAPTALHIKDVPRIVAAQREEKAKLLARRGPSRSRRDLLEKEKVFDQPPPAEEVGYENVLVLNESMDRSGLAALNELIPQFEVMFLEFLFHFQQLLEFVLETRVPYLTFNLENLFKHLLEGTVDGSERDIDGVALASESDFKRIQLPVFARGLIYMCQKERRDVLSYYTFIYASVVCKFMLRSSELQSILAQQNFLDQLIVDHSNPTATAIQRMKAKEAGKGNALTLALLTDIKSSPLSSSSKGLHFYQRTKPLLETMLKLLLDG